MTAKAIAPPFQQMMTPLQQMQQGFQNTMQQIQNDPFPLIEQFLGQRAMSQVDQAMQPMQQEALQKVSSVMSGIRSLVNEAFPNMGGGGISTTGQLGQGGGGIASLGGTAIPAAPFTKPAEIPSTPMQPPMMGDLSQISTPQITQPENDILKNFGSEVTTPAFTGPNSQNTYVGGTLVTPQPMGEPAGPPPGLPPIPPMVGGSGMGNPMALIEPPMIPKIADIGPVTANPTPKVSVEESGPVFQDTYNPAVTTIDDILAGQGGFLKKQVEDPLINLAYNFNMENSPF